MTYQLPEPIDMATTNFGRYGYTSAQMQAAYAAGVAARDRFTWTGTEADLAVILLGRLDVSGDDAARVDQIEEIVKTMAMAIRARGEDMSDLSALRGIQGVGL
jgi:hypothetical protein